jgi:translation elongation factor EF-G
MDWMEQEQGGHHHHERRNELFLDARVRRGRAEKHRINIIDTPGTWTSRSKWAKSARPRWRSACSTAGTASTSERNRLAAGRQVPRPRIAFVNKMDRSALISR